MVHHHSEIVQVVDLRVRVGEIPLRLVARVVPMPWFLSDDQGIDMYTSPRVLLI